MGEFAEATRSYSKILIKLLFWNTDASSDKYTIIVLYLIIDFLELGPHFMLILE